LEQEVYMKKGKGGCDCGRCGNTECRSFAAASYKAVVVENGKEVVNEEASRAWVDGELVKDVAVDKLKKVAGASKKQIGGKKGK
jgi:hypothetical protein